MLNRVPALVLAILAALPACTTAPPASSPEEIARFERAGPYRPKVNRLAIFDAKTSAGPYRVSPDDVLEFTMPAVMQAIATSATPNPAPHLSRVSAAGKITLPLVGELEVAGKTLAEIEALAVGAYQPKYLRNRPSIVAAVKEYSTVNVFVTGAVETPGMYPLAGQERTLASALMKAGGIREEGASLVKIYSSEKHGPSEPIALPVEGYNIPFDNQNLHGGETIEVLPLDPQVFTVVGLVKNPGTYEYPLGARYSLLQAIGFGGGLDVPSSPSIVQVFRQDASGEIVSAAFDVTGESLSRAAFIPIKRGDIIAIGDTLETKWNRFLSTVFRGGIYLGANYQLNQRR